MKPALERITNGFSFWYRKLAINDEATETQKNINSRL